MNKESDFFKYSTNDSKIFEALFQDSHVAIVLLNENRQFIRVNNKFCEFLGYSEEELLKLSPIDVTVEDDIEKTASMINNMMADKKPNLKIEKKYRKKNGSIAYGEVRSKQIKLDSGELLYCGTIVDITNRKKQEIEFENQKVKLENIINYSNLGIIYTNSDKEVVSINKRVLEILGYEMEEELLGRTFMSFTHPDDIERDLKEVNKIISNEINTFSMTKRYIRKDNSLVWVDLNVTVIRDELTGEISNFVGMIKDISERMEKEEALRSSEERLKLVTSYAKFGIWDWDVKNNILVWEDSMYALYELKKEDFTGAFDAWQRTLDSRDAEAANIEVQKALNGEKEFNTVFRIITSSGHVRHIQAHGNVQFDENGEPVRMIGVNYDVSQKVKNEIEKHNAIIRTEEVERQRISHDLHDGLGQTIAAANMFMNTLKSYVEEQFDEEAQEIFHSGKLLLEKAAKETRLVSHSIMPRSLNNFGLEESLNQMLNNYQTLDTELEVNLESNLGGFRFTEEKELTVFRTLQESINNSIKHSKSKKLNCKLHLMGEKLFVSVIDEGVGFDLEKVKNKKDSGIGLLSLRHRIEMIGGELDIDTKIGVGTSINFTIRLDDKEANA